MELVVGDNSELERLNRLGRDAAKRALRGNRVNHTSDTHRPMEMSLNRHRVTTTGRVAVSALVWFVITLVLAVYGYPKPVLVALGAVILLEFGYFFFKRQRNRRLGRKAVSLQSQLHDLKQQEFDLRYQEAKESGALGKFGDKS